MTAAYKIISTLLFLISAPSWAQTVQYRSIEPLKSGSQGFRTTWDSTKQFCFKSPQAERSCFDITGMGEIKLRESGQWDQYPASQNFIEQLGPELRSQAENYDRVFVRYLALGGTNEFVVHVFFVSKGSSARTSQTIFAMGDIAGSRARVSAMSFSSPMEEFGGTVAAVANLPMADKNKTEAINAYIVQQNLTLLLISQSVVTTYLQTAAPGGTRLP